MKISSKDFRGRPGQPPELGRTLDFVKVPTREKDEVLVALAAHKDEVTRGLRRGR
jgi:hemoglobin